MRTEENWAVARLDRIVTEHELDTVGERAWNIARMETQGRPKTSVAGRAKQRLAERHFEEFMELVAEECVLQGGERS